MTHHVRAHHVRRARTRNEHGSDHDVGTAHGVRDIRSVRIETGDIRTERARGHELVAVLVEYHHIGAETGRDDRCVAPGDPATEDDRLPARFWQEAELGPRGRKSVHLKLDPEVFEFFKQGGKGHLTRMQNVLAAYVRARKRG